MLSRCVAVSQTGDARTVAELLGRGAKIEVKAKNNLGATPLHLAAKLGHIRIARELLAAGARADAKDQVRPCLTQWPYPEMQMSHCIVSLYCPIPLCWICCTWACSTTQQEGTRARRVEFTYFVC